MDYEYIRPSTISAMNISAGIFTAPKDGTYSVQFNARSVSQISIYFDHIPYSRKC